MSYLLTFCAGLLTAILLHPLVQWILFHRMEKRIDQAVSRSWRKQEERQSYRNQFDGVSWTWPVKK